MKLIATRLTKGTDLKTAIEAFVRDQAISAATIISGVGSLAQVTMRMAGARPDAQDIRTLDGPFEIVSLIGNIGPERSHIHISVSDADGVVQGGHLKEGTIVETTVELVLAIDERLYFGKAIDEHTGFEELEVTYGR